MNDMSHLPERIISAKELLTMVPYSLGWITQLEARDEFPKRLQLGTSRVGWKLSEVMAWIEERPRGTAPEPARLQSNHAA